jgi:hypothetical protein
LNGGFGSTGENQKGGLSFFWEQTLTTWSTMLSLYLILAVFYSISLFTTILKFDPI